MPRPNPARMAVHAMSGDFRKPKQWLPEIKLAKYGRYVAPTNWHLRDRKRLDVPARDRRSFEPTAPTDIVEWVLTVT